jgi:predicted phage gp36 major capsid-like protein
MAFTATQYLFKATNHTSTTTATVGGYTVPASTRGEIMALTCANTSTGNLINYIDVSLYDPTASASYPIQVKAPVYPGGNLTVYAAAKQVLPTGGAVYVTPYATAGVLTSVMTIIEVT